MRPGLERRPPVGTLRRVLRIGSGMALLASCSGNVATPSDASTSSTHALLTVERTHPGTEPATSARTHAAAYFLRVQAGADQVIATRLLSDPPRLPAEGQCEPVQLMGEQGIPLASMGPVELIDVGEVIVQAEQTRATLATRAFPNVVDLISGVVYTTRDRSADPLPERGAYAFLISGSTALPGMTLGAQAPGGVEDLTIAGSPLASDPVSLPRADLTIGWRPQADRDVLYVELASSEDGPLERVRCNLGNTGQATIPAALLPKASAQNLAVHLLHHESLAVPGLDSGEVRFDIATTSTLHFDAPRP